MRRLMFGVAAGAILCLLGGVATVPLLRDAGAVQEAASLTADLRMMNAIDDPWLRYTAGSLRQWHERFALVREALKKYKAPDSSYDGRTN
jgi:hypothetical protein